MSWERKNCYKTRLRERGTLKPNNSRGRRRTRKTTAMWKMFYTRMRLTVRISTRRLAAQTFHNQQAQDILPQDLPLRRQFYQLLLYRHAEDPRFLANIIFSDESTYTRSGKIFPWQDEVLCGICMTVLLPFIATNADVG
ncbi:hypothetical protein NQ318_019114 [Aromia moschata]|uniref:PiggyBac transposable element-derived protein domain-containing protein n=1 Tax=Aromia moschata TaxID=1265417 RepID=A0AAV8XQD5_9CUCU|nr:hypothetical protein NQ318_019114 [Aromia moschata]